MAERFEVRAKARHIQMTPRKVRLVIDAVRGMGAREALDILRFMPNSAADPVYKVIRSAVANAEENYGLEIDELYVSSIQADEGPRHRLAPYGGRFAGRGRLRPVLQRNTHHTVSQAERDGVDY